jgi:hypothetical protein
MAQQAISARIEQSFWPALLIAVSAVSTLGFACVTPFAAFAVAAAYVLPIRSALIAVGGVWLANQAIGFACLSYPLAVDTFLWGVAIGASALLATAFASLVLRSMNTQNYIGSIGTALLVAFASYEIGLFVVTFGLGSQEAFSPVIVGKFALLNVVWAIGLVGASLGVRYVGATRMWPRLPRAVG